MGSNRGHAISAWFLLHHKSIKQYHLALQTMGRILLLVFHVSARATPVDATGLCHTGHSNLEANTNLATYISSMPSPPLERLTFSRRGMLINTTATPKVLEYTINSSSTCPSIGAALSALP